MPAYTVFDAGTGAILRSGVCAAEDLHRQAMGPGEIVTEGAYADDRFEFAGATPNGWPSFRRQPGAGPAVPPAPAVLPGKLTGTPDAS